MQHLDWKPACDVPDCIHGRPQARWAIYLACSCVGLMCQPCKTDMDRDRTADPDWWTTPAWFDCRRCGRTMHMSAEAGILRIEPL